MWVLLEILAVLIAVIGWLLVAVCFASGLSFCPEACLYLLWLTMNSDPIQQGIVTLVIAAQAFSSFSPKASFASASTSLELKPNLSALQFNKSESQLVVPQPDDSTWCQWSQALIELRPPLLLLILPKQDS